jgi:hypothetical protein
MENNSENKGKKRNPSPEIDGMLEGMIEGGSVVSEEKEIEAQVVDTRKKVDETLQGARKEPEKAKEGDRLSRTVEKRLANFWPKNASPELKAKIVGKIYNFLKDLPKDQGGKSLPEDRANVMDMLVEHLNQKLFRKTPIREIDSERIKEIEKLIRAGGDNGESNAIATLNKELATKKAERRKLEGEYNRLAKESDSIQLKSGEQNLIDLKDSLKEPIADKAAEVEAKIDEIEELEAMNKAVKPIAENLANAKKKPNARKLLIHLNFFIEQYKGVNEALENKRDPTELGEKEGETYKKSMAEASKELGRLKISETEKPGLWATIGRRFVRTKHLLRFAAESKLADSFGGEAKDKEEGAKLIVELRKLPKDGKASVEAFDKWLADVGALVSKEGDEGKIRQWGVNLVTILETSINGQKWRQGINVKDMKEVITISNRIRQAMERKIASEKEDVAEVMAEVELLDKQISDSKKKAGGRLPKELREHFDKSYWAKRASKFMGLKLFEGGKATVIGVGTGVGKGIALGSKKVWEKIKAHPWKTAGIVAGLATGTLVGGAICYGLYMGYKKFRP